MVHLPIHLASEARIGGPVHYRWMYPIERFLYTLKKYVRNNRAQPEGSIAEGYLANECVTFMTRYMGDLESRMNRPPRYEDDAPIGGVNNFILSYSEVKQVHQYILSNDDDVSYYIKVMAEDQQIPAKRGRGPTQLSWLDDLPPGGTLKIEVDKYKQPIGSNSTYLSSYIGYLARDVNRFPLSITDWKKMVKFREEEINKAIDQIKQIFEIPFECNKFLSERLNARWKDHKCTVKKEHFSSYDNLDECLANPPDGIEPSEWMNVVDYWNSEDAKKQSRQNAKNKALQQIPHTGGSKSHAKYADELRKELNASPPRTTVYKRTHTRKRNLAPVNELAAEKIDKMEKLQHQMTQEDGEFVDSGPNDIFAQVMGRDRGGRVRCYGPVKPKQFWDKDTLNSKKKRRSDDVEKNQQIKDLQDQLKSALERLEQLENDRSGGSNTQKDSQGPTPGQS